MVIIMKIDELLCGLKNSIEINEVYEIPKEYYQNTEIITLKPVKIEGNLKKTDTNIILEANISGSMILPDSVSLEQVNYPFSIKIEENVEEKIKNNENTIAIIDILWENIVLEIPIRYSEVKDYSDFSGDGWSLIEEESYQKSAVDNPFKELKGLFGEEEE